MSIINSQQPFVASGQSEAQLYANEQQQCQSIIRVQTGILTAREIEKEDEDGGKTNHCSLWFPGAL